MLPLNSVAVVHLSMYVDFDAVAVFCTSAQTNHPDCLFGKMTRIPDERNSDPTNFQRHLMVALSGCCYSFYTNYSDK